MMPHDHHPRPRTDDPELDRIFADANAEADATPAAPIEVDNVLRAVFGHTEPRHSPVSSGVSSLARPQLRARRTRAAIIRSAAVEFGKSGYAAASLNRILEGSRATKGAMYFHFDSKEELAHAVMDAARDRYQASTERWLARTDLGPLDALHGMIDEIALRLQHDIIVQGELHLLTDPELHRDDQISSFHILGGAIRQLAVRAIERMQLRPDCDPDRFTRTLLAALAGQRHITEALTGPMDLRSRLAEALEVIVEATATVQWIEEFRLNGWLVDASLAESETTAAASTEVG
ncbi:TetR/AcrR family transcriptional regulator [Nocardia beijingensis]|uniref:TetR/AcrR family transcriptional regulator n=1 Tax=Nocardia beijingensis TaxID=95162 RepID=UPI00344DBC1A